MGVRTMIRFSQSALFASILGLSSPLLATTPPTGIAGQTSLAQLSLVGLPADRLLASGLSTPQILGAAQRLRAAGGQLEDLDGALHALADAQRTLKSTLAQTQDTMEGGANPAIQSARATVADCELRVSAIRTVLRQLVLSDASPAQVALLERALDGAQIGLDGALSLGADTAAMHDQLAVALQAEARSIRIGEELDPDYRDLLETVRALPQVAAAAARLAAEWPALEIALSAPPESE